MILHELKYACDCGSLKVGNKDYQILVENGCGDGRFNAYVVDSEDDLPRNKRFVGCAYLKNMHLFPYDCENYMTSESWTGSFFFYNDEGDVYAHLFSTRNHWDGK